jgi:hypothetical protein
MRPLPRLSAALAAALLVAGCGSDHLIEANDSDSGTPVAPNPTPTPQPDGGPPVSACHSDCDCGSGSYCAPATAETGATCLPGNNTCPKTCPACGPYQQCNTTTGTCVPLTCPGQVTCGNGYYCAANGTCQPNSTEISVDGVWKTTYGMDVSEFAQNAQIALVILDLLNALVTGQGTCANLSTPYGELLCYIVQYAGVNLQAPPFVSQLLSTLEDLFKFGSSPVTAQGQMTLAQGANNTLSATESWSSVWVNFNGQQLDLMHSPVLGTNGQVTVTVPPFGGYRDASSVYLGPRDVSLDVNHFLIALIDVAIDAFTNGQATDIPSLVDLVLCTQLPTAGDQLACALAAQSFLGNLTASSGLGGFHMDHQNAPLFDTGNTGTANELATPAAQGALLGSMSNGVVSGELGPSSGWYGTR